MMTLNAVEWARFRSDKSITMTIGSLVTAVSESVSGQWKIQVRSCLTTWSVEECNAFGQHVQNRLEVYRGEPKPK
jgi:hypothetical protein